MHGSAQQDGQASRQRHLVSVWNPSVAIDALDAHAGVLLEQLRAVRQGKGDEADVYVWWGKVRSPNRQQALPHADEVLRMNDESPDDEDDQREMHLYLTDYRSLYVGQVAAITVEDVGRSEPAHVPAYYREQKLECDLWFQLWDIRRLVQDDTVAVVAELKRLRNTHYNDRPVSIYGGMVNLPLIVYRDDDVRYFDRAERDRLLEGRTWVEFDAESAGPGAIERELRENLFGEAAWLALDNGTRTFILTGEQMFRANRGSAGFDFGPVVTAFGKALEVECNRRLRQGVARAPAASRQANIEGATLDLGQRQALSLGQIANAIRSEPALQQALISGLTNGRWFAGELPAILNAFREVRNEGSHQAVVERDKAQYWRNLLLGIGCEGYFVTLARGRPA